MALQIERISDLVEKIKHSKDQLAVGDSSVRLSMLQWAWNLAQALETPYESLMRLLLVDPATIAFIRVGIAVQLFEHLGDDESQAATSHELAQKTGVEEALLGKHLAVSGVVYETGPDRYLATPMSKSLANDKSQDTLQFYNTVFVPALGAVPEFFSQTGYREPKDGTKTPIQMALNTDLHVFEYVKGNVELARLFKAAVLSGDVRRSAHWDTPAFYPVQERLLSGLRREDDSVLMVDIAGGMGLDLAGLHEAFGDTANGRLILQDTEQVLSTVDNLPSRIEKMAHDFFQPQPVKGARAYYLHHIFHDWSDDECCKILLALKPALIPGYSKVLIQDHVIPSKDATWWSTTSDVLMMVGFAGKERTRGEFEALFESVGMKITGFWTRAPNEESVVEAVVLN